MPEESRQCQQKMLQYRMEQMEKKERPRALPDIRMMLGVLHQITIPESVSRWALMLNVSRPSLHRELKKLEEKGLITYRPPVIQINDPDRLQELLS